MNLNKNKLDGKSLEKAVALIETHVLDKLSKKDIAKISIETNKIITLNNVRNEIDVFVEVDLKIGTNLVYIFECKNWKKTAKISKNDIIIFSEKIKICKAQKGYFVAKLYSRDAKNQAKIDDRIELIILDSFNSKIFDINYFPIIKTRVVKKIEMLEILAKPEKYVNNITIDPININKTHIQFGESSTISLLHYIKEIVRKGESVFKKLKNNEKVIISNLESLTTVNLTNHKWVFYSEIYNVKLNSDFYKGVRFKVNVEYEFEDPKIIFEYNLKGKGHYAKIKLRGLFENEYSLLEVTKNEIDGTIKFHDLELI